MKTCFASVSAAFLAAVSSASAAIVASDNASNYGSGWTSGSNGGFGFGAWGFTTSGGGFKGAFIGDPANIGVTGMGSSAFAIYANGSDTPTMSATRYFNNQLNVGDSFSFQWGINWTSGYLGSKGINIFTGSTPIEIRCNGNSDQVLVNGQDVGFGYGTNAMTWTLTQTSWNTVNISANDRDGSGAYSTTLYVAGPLNGFLLWAQGLGAGGEREPYFNNFTITAVPAPGALALLGVAGLVGSRRRR